MEEGKPNESIELREKRGPQLNWRFIRRIEAVVFTSMFVAVPFFAFRIVDIAGTSLMVRNTATDLVKDLIRAREIAKDYGLSITVCSVPPISDQPSSYVIQNGIRTIEQVVLPRGVAMAGAVTFDDKGSPQNRAAFVITKGTRVTTVDVDRLGQTSVR